MIEQRVAATPIELGGGQSFVPYVMSPVMVPQIVNTSVARADPELAVFSAMAHGQRAALDISVQIAAAALTASAGLDADRARLYGDLVLSSISEAARRALLIMNPANYEFQSEFARYYISLGRTEGKLEGQAHGKAEGIAEGKATLLLKLATLKFGTVPDDFNVKLRTATDPELDSMAERLLIANSIEEMLSAG